jgi:PilZ domain-containing protein
MHGGEGSVLRMPASRSIVHYSRLHYRVSVHYPVILYSNAVTRVGLMTTLSVNGCTIECQKSLNPSLHIKVHVRLPNQSGPLIIEAAAIRWSCGSSYGLEFLIMHNRQQLNRCVIEEIALAVSDHSTAKAVMPDGWMRS